MRDSIFLLAIISLFSLEARLHTSQYPSKAHCDEQYIASPGVPRWAVMPVNATIWPFLVSLILGNTALTTLTGPKKLVSNWSRTNDCVRPVCDISSTLPTKASLLQISRISIRPNAANASATADCVSAIFLCRPDKLLYPFPRAIQRAKDEPTSHPI